MELIFDKGTIRVEGLSLEKLRSLPLIQWDPRVRFHRAPPFRYPELVSDLHRKGLPFVDRIGGWKKIEDLNHPVELRPYQDAALAAWSAANHRGMVVLPTGAGKTHVAMAAISLLKSPSLNLVPTKVLLEQWSQRLQAAFQGPIGVIGDGRNEVCRVTVTTFESAYRHMSRIGHLFELLIVDEVHHFGNGFRDEALEMCAAPFRLGLTATPVEGEGAGRLVQWVGATVYKLGIAELSGNFLAPFDHQVLNLTLSVEERYEYELEMSKFRRFYRALAESKGTLDWKTFVRTAMRTQQGQLAVLSWRKAKRIAHFTKSKQATLSRLLDEHKDKKTLIFTGDSSVAYEISRKLLVMPITADIKTKERRDVLAKFSRGELRALVSCRVLNEGFDLPDAQIAVIVGGALGEREHVQRMGRCLRPGIGKRAVIYELVSEETLEVGQ